MPSRRLVASTTIAVCALSCSALAQIPGQNVNMVSGTEWPGGDPFLQRQNEPSIAVSSRNPQHLLAGANDYRTVDLPGLPDGEEPVGDAWLGLFKSPNGGQTWRSTLLPGYPQDQSAAGLASPLKGFEAGADPVVRAGTHGLFYYGGLAFNRGEKGLGAIFVARYVDRNNKENGDTIGYLGTTIVARGTPGQFVDKPAMAVGLPDATAGTCVIDGRPIASGPVYVAWSTFVGQQPPSAARGTDNNLVRSKLYIARSNNCGASFGQASLLSEGSHSVQSTAIAIDPRNGTVYVAWRQFLTVSQGNTILVARSSNGGRTFSRPAAVVGSFASFDQPTTGTTFRTNSYPAITVDPGGRLYIAWSARGYAPANMDPIHGDARIVLSTSRDGVSFTMPRAIDNPVGPDGTPLPGHQVMPAILYAGGRVQVLYYDLREDVSGFFERFVDEFAVFRVAPPLPRRRHTLDVRTAQALPGDQPDFASYAVNDDRPAARASQYLVGSRPGIGVLEQLQFNPPNLPLYALGALPFMGDYIDLAARPFLPETGSDGQERWRVNGEGGEPIFHLTWTDNRDVRPPVAPKTWADYTPPEVAVSNAPSRFDPTQNVPPCVPGQAGMRNANIYTSRVTPGLVAGSPGNSKPLSLTLPRTFVVFAQNTTTVVAAYRFTIANQPPGGSASFLQFSPLARVDVLIAPKSSVARTVYVTSTDPDARVRVDVEQIAAPDAPPVPGGLNATVILNPDITNPDITNPDITNPDITNPDITNVEVHNPDITNPDITNPDITNPDITNPDITNPDITNIEVANPDITNPDITNPDITNPDITNPDITNPDITNPDITNGSITDYSYTVTNAGNTSSQYTVNLATETGEEPEGFTIQLVVHRQYQTPVAEGCNLKQQTQNQVVANIVDPEFVAIADLETPDPTNPDLGNVSFWLDPGESVRITIRVVDPDRNDGITFDPTRTVAVAVVAAAVNSDDAADGVVTPPFQVLPTAFGDAFVAAGSLDVPAPGVLGNDVLPAGALAQLVSAPAHAATFTLRPDGSFSYTPAAGFTGVDAFEYAAAIGTRVSNPATVLLQVEGPATYVVVTTNDAGPGSLRQAILNANLHPGADSIAFNIPGEGVRTISPSSAFDALVEPVTIDGSTQPGYAAAYGPLIEIDGAYAGASASGLEIKGGASVIRALAIGRFGRGGIVLQGSGHNVVELVRAGTDARGTAARGNGRAGIEISDSSDNIVRDSLVSGNAGEGVRIDGALSTRNSVTGNYVGTNASGAKDLGNAASGVYIRRSPGNVVSGNVVSGNDGFAGIAICGRPSFCGGGDIGTQGSDAASNVVQGNRIGVGAGGTVALGNTGYGVSIDGARKTLVGGPGLGNVIAFNGRDGISLFFSEPNALGNDFNENAIYSNGDRAIDLGDDGPTRNDRGDADEGPNRLQNFPVLEQVIAYGGRLTVTGSIDTTPGAVVRLDFFTSDGCGEYGTNPQARRFIGSAERTAGHYGPTAFTIDLPGYLGWRESVTATATVEGNTSEVSACRSAGESEVR